MALLPLQLFVFGKLPKNRRAERKQGNRRSDFPPVPLGNLSHLSHLEELKQKHLKELKEKHLEELKQGKPGLSREEILEKLNEFCQSSEELQGKLVEEKIEVPGQEELKSIIAAFF
jgi:hypothetical protein